MILSSAPTDSPQYLVESRRVRLCFREMLMAVAAAFQKRCLILFKLPRFPAFLVGLFSLFMVKRGLRAWDVYFKFSTNPTTLNPPPPHLPIHAAPSCFPAFSPPEGCHFTGSARIPLKSQPPPPPPRCLCWLVSRRRRGLPSRLPNAVSPRVHTTFAGDICLNIVKLTVCIDVQLIRGCWKYLPLTLCTYTNLLDISVSVFNGVMEIS